MYPHLNSADGKARPRAGDQFVGRVDPRFARDDDEIHPGDVYDLRIQWGRQTRIKCPVCSKFVRDDLEIVCRCGSVFSKCPEEGQYQVVRISGAG